MGNAQAQQSSHKKHSPTPTDSTDFSSTASFSSAVPDSPTNGSGNRSSVLSDSSHDFEFDLLAGFSTLQVSPEFELVEEKNSDWDDSLFQGVLRDQKVLFKKFDIQALLRDGEDLLENLQLNISVIGTLPPHDNVVKFIGTSVTNQTVCVLIEHAQMRLIDIAKTNEFQFQDKLQACIDVASAVFHLHENYIVHGSVSLNNVFLVSGQKAGSYIAKLNSFPLLREKHTDTELSKPVDVFDFGVMIYELLFGVIAPGTDVQSCISNSHLQDVFGQQLVEIMKDCADPDPEKRPSFGEIKMLLDDLLKQTCIPLYVSRFASGTACRHRHRNVFIIDRNQIFGRDIELHTAKDAIERAQQSNAQSGGITPQMCRCLFIGGPSGIGKTCFVRTLFRVLTESLNREQVSYFSGKYAQFEHNAGSSTPFSAIVQALTQLIQTKILDPAEKNPSHLKKWKKIMSKALKKNGQVITTILPIVETIIGPQRPPPEASQTETRARFWSTFSTFYDTLATPTHKVVLFLDDMQWSDESSMTMLEKLLANPHTFLIATYRDNEVKPGHHLLQFMDKISRSNLTKSLTLTLCPPSARDLNKICARTLRCLSEEQTLSLSEFIHAKTGGNPFFFVQYFSMLEREGFIRYNQESGEWSWDVEDIKQQSPAYSSDIVSMMVAGLKQLSQRSRQILQMASCLGSTFSFELLSRVCTRIPIADAITVGEIQEDDLAECLAHNLLQRSSSSSSNAITFSFSHDRVLQAATSLWGNMSEMLPRIQLEIGRLIKAQSPSIAMGPGIFDVVGRFNAGSDLIVDPDELLGLVKMNMMAVQNSVKSAAYSTALSFVRIAHKLLFERFPLLVGTTTSPESDDSRQQFVWAQQHTLALKVSLSSAQLEFMLADISSGDRHFAAIRKFARMGCDGAELHASEMAIAQAFCSKGEALMQRLKYVEGAGTFFQYFQLESTDPRLRGHFVDELRSATEDTIASLYRRVKAAFEESMYKQIDEIQVTWNEGEWRSPDLILLLALMPVASVIYPANDVAFLVLRTAELFVLAPGALSHKLPPSIFVCLSLITSSVMFKFKDFDMVSSVASKLWSHPNLLMSPIAATNLDYSALALFSSVRSISKNMLRKHLPLCIKSGEISSAALTVGISLFSLHLCGKTLPSMLAMIGKVRSFFETNFSTVLIALTNIKGTASGLNFLLDGTLPDPQFEMAISACPSKYIKMCYNFYFSIGHYIYGDFPKAVAYSTQACANKLPGGNRIQDEAGLLLLQCLSICRGCVSTQQARDETLHTIDTAILPELTTNFEKARFSENFATQYYLACAERTRIFQLSFDSQGPNNNTQDSAQRADIISLYQKAISAARKAGLILLELLAQEALNLFLSDCGMTDELLKQTLLAFDNYLYFGASRKVAMIRSNPVMAAAIEAKEADEKKQASSMFLTACASGDFRTVKRLSSRNTDLFRSRDIDQSTPLHKAVVNDSFEGHKITNLLLKHGASIKAIDIHGSTPLHWAAQNSNSKAISMMLQQKRQPSQEGRTPTPGTDGGLSSSEIKSLLCTRDAFGYTPLHLALRPHDDSTTTEAKEAQFQTATVLVMYGADVNIKTSSGDTVLHVACDSGPESPRLAIVNFLLTNQPSIKLGIKDRNGNTPLMRATRNGFAHILEAFLNFICEKPHTESPTPSSPQRNPDSPPMSPLLFVTAHSPFASTALSEHTDSKGQNLLHIAASNDCAEVLSLIRRLPIGNTPTQMSLSGNVFAAGRSLPLWMRMLVFERDSQFQRNAIQIALRSGSMKFLALSQQLVDEFGEGIKEMLCSMQDSSGESMSQLAARVSPSFSSWLIGNKQ